MGVQDFHTEMESRNLQSLMWTIKKRPPILVIDLDILNRLSYLIIRIEDPLIENKIEIQS